MKRALVLAFLAACLSAAMAAETPRRLGFTVLTHEDAPTIPEGTAVVRYEGPIAYPMAADLRDVWAELRGSVDTVILELDSGGGELAEAEAAIATLRDVRRHSRLETIVGYGKRCLSACVLVFVQGEERAAAGASAWMFHGVCPAYSTVPAPEPTRRYLDLLREAGVSTVFLCDLVRSGWLDRPGRFWSSGYELVHVHEAGVITRLLDAWQPLEARRAPVDPLVRPR